MAFRIFSKAFSEDSIFLYDGSWSEKHRDDGERYGLSYFAPMEYYEKVKVKLYDWRMGFGIENKYPKRVIE